MASEGRHPPWESYQLKHPMKAELTADGGVGLADAIEPDLLLPRETLEAYGALDPGIHPYPENPDLKSRAP